MLSSPLGLKIHGFSFSGFRALLAEPKTKVPESPEQDYHSSGRQEALGQEPRANLFPFGEWPAFPSVYQCAAYW